MSELEKIFMFGNEESIKYAVNNSIDNTMVNVNYYGDTLLHLLCKRFKREDFIMDIINTFFDKGFELNTVNDKKCTILHILSEYIVNYNLLNKLLDLYVKHDIDLSCLNNEKQNILHILCKQNQCVYTINRVFNLFISNNLDVNQLDMYSYTPFMILLTKINVDSELIKNIFDLHINNNIDLFQKTRYDLTFLHELSIKNRDEELMLYIFNTLSNNELTKPYLKFHSKTLSYILCIYNNEIYRKIKDECNEILP